MKLSIKIICIVAIFTTIYLLNNQKVEKKIENFLKLKRFPSTWTPKNIGASCECLANEINPRGEFVYRGSCKYDKKIGPKETEKRCIESTKLQCSRYRNGKWRKWKNCKNEDIKNKDPLGYIENAPWTERGKQLCSTGTKKCISGDDATLNKSCTKDSDCGKYYGDQLYKDMEIKSADSGVSDRGHRTGGLPISILGGE